MTEIDILVKRFDDIFSSYKDGGIAVYGIGSITKAVLEAHPDFNILGLLDETRVDDNVYGKPVISMSQAVKIGVKVIVIIARIANVNIIYRRIKDECNRHSIAVYDLGGNKLGITSKKIKSFEKYKDVTKKELKLKIDNAEVVSFDVFDTLVMRRVLYPSDVYEIGNELLVKRDSMVDMLDYALLNKKDIYLLSDMYLTNVQIKTCLEDMGITIEVEKILVSCDFGITKPDGLFDILHAKVRGKRILHIGDSFEADIIAAKKFGINDTFQIYNALTMLEDSYTDDILAYDKTIQDRLLIGEFSAKELNDPFIFSATNGRLKIDSYFQLGYSYIAPFIMRVFSWIVQQAASSKLEMVLLSSRDGYIFEKIYQLFKDKYEIIPMKYCYTSRIASVLASIRNENDIINAAILPFAGTPKEMLIKRFFLEPNEICKKLDNEDAQNYILKHANMILCKAKNALNNYQKYLKKQKIHCVSKIGFFDFVSSGTCQNALEHIFGTRLHGLYCAVIEHEKNNLNNLQIESLFGKLSTLDPKYHFLSNYFQLESFILSPEPSLAGFSPDGEPIFLKEQRSEIQLNQLAEVHRGILEYATCTNLTLSQFASVDINLVDKIFHSSNSFGAGLVYDEFTNRSFES